MRTICTAVLVAALTASAACEDWPQFRGKNGDAVSNERGINKDWGKKPPKLLWKLPVGDEGFAGAAVAGGKVFFVDHSGNDDIVRALNLKDGTEIWRYAYPDVDKPNYGFARATPTIANGKVYTYSRKGTINCLDEKTGKLIWSANATKDLGGMLPQWEVAASPTIDGKKLIVVTGADKPITALDKDTGKVIWQGGKKDYPGYATPVVANIEGKKEYLVFLGINLQGLDPDTGACLWSFPWHSANIAQPIVVGSNSVLLCTDWDKSCCVLVDIHGSDAKPHWQSTEFKAHFNSPVLVDGYFYGIGNPGFLTCVQAATGKVMWKEAGFEKGGVLAVDGTLIAMNGSNGDVFMAKIDPTGYRKLGKLDGLGGTSWSPPVLSNGKLIVRNTKSLACYDLK